MNYIMTKMFAIPIMHIVEIL